MSDSKQLKVNISSNLLFTLLGMVAPLVVIPVLTQGIGVLSYGKYVTILSMAALLFVLTDFGLSMYLPKEISGNRDNSKLINSLASSFIHIKFSFGILSSLIAALLVDDSSVISIFSAFYVFLLILNPTPLLSGLEEYKWLAVCQVVAKSVLVSTVLIVDFGHMGVEKALLIQCMMNVILNALLYYKVVKLFNIEIFNGKSIDLIKRSFDFYIARLFTNIYQQSSTYLVSFFLISEQVAIYSIAVQLYKLGTQLVGAIAKVLYTSTAYSKNLSPIRKVTLLTILLYVFVALLIKFSGEDFLSFVFDFEVGELFLLSCLLYFSLLFVILSSFWGYPALTSIGKEKYAHLGVFLSALGYFICFLLATSWLELTVFSFVFCILLADVIGAAVRLYFAKKFELL